MKLLSLVRPLATPWTAAHQTPHPWDFPGKSTGVRCHCLLQCSWCEFDPWSENTNCIMQQKKNKNQTNPDLFLNKQTKQWNSIPVLKTAIENTLIGHRPDIKSAPSNFISEVKSLSCVSLFAIPWSVAHQAPPSMEFSKQQYWSRLPFPSPGDLPDPGIEPWSPTLQADALLSEPPRPYKTQCIGN